LYRLRMDAPDVFAQYAGMGDILREYIQTRFGLPAGDLTTAELINQMGEQQMLRTARLKELEYLLEQADLAKFAPSGVYTPKEGSLTQLASQWVKAIEQETRQ